MEKNQNRVLRIIARVIHVIIAVVFLIAAVSKALDPPAFVDQIAAYNILPGLAPFGAWFFIIIECVLAGMLIVNAIPKFTQIASGILLLLFTAVTLYAMTTGSLSNCGCFGNIMPRTPEQTMIEDLIMLAALGFAMFVTWREPASKTLPKLGFGAFVGILGLLTGLFYQSIPADNLATQLKPGANFTSWPVEGLYEDINKGTHVVFLFSIEMSEIENRIQRMNDIAQSNNISSTIGLVTDGSEQLTALIFQYGTGFPVGAIEPRFARNLYRSLPRSFIIQDGNVVETWSEIPTKDEVLTILNQEDE
jgi:methylamine utilization protein MauE